MLSQILSGKRVPSLLLLRRICQELKFSSHDQIIAEDSLIFVSRKVVKYFADQPQIAMLRKSQDEVQIDGATNAELYRCSIPFNSEQKELALKKAISLIASFGNNENLTIEIAIKKTL